MKLFPIILMLIFSISISAQNLEKMLIKADKFESQNKYKKALKLYNKILEEDNTNTLTFGKRGLCYFHLDEIDKSFEDLIYFQKKNPTSAVANAYIGLIYSIKKNFNKAIEFYDYALKNNYNADAVFYFNYGSAYYFSGKNSEAIIYLEKSFKMDPSYSGVYNNLAWSYLETDPEKSCKFFNLAYQKDSTNDVSINNLGYAHLLNKEYNKAIELFEKANKINPENSFVYRNIGLYYKEIKNKELACEYLQKAKEHKIVERWGKHYIADLQNYCN